MTPLVLAAVLVLLPQQPRRDVPPVSAATHDAALYGKITDDRGQVVAGVLVIVVGVEPGGARTALSDADGRYTVSGLPPGRYPVVASKAGYPKVAYGQLFTGGAGTLAVLTQSQKTEANISLPRGAAITGVLLDDRGEPMRNAGVSVSRPPDEETLTRPFTVARATTDERGAFRLWGLPAGEYVVEASSRYENPSAPAGPSVRVAPGEERAVALRDVAVPSVSARVSGTVLTADGGVMRGVSVQLYQQSGPSGISSVNSNDGVFLFRTVPAGTYTIVARGSIFTPAGPGRGSSSTPYFAIEEIRIEDEQPVTVSLTLSVGTSLSGRVVPLMTSGTFDFSKLFLQLVRLDSAQSSIGGWLGFTKNADGSFVIAGIPPGRYAMRLTGAAEHQGWTFRSAMVEGIDLFDFPIRIGTEPVKRVEVTVSDRQTLLEGRTTRDNAALIVYSRDRRYWFRSSRRLALIRPDSEGAFSLRGLPEGTYLVAAASKLPEAWQQVQFLERLSPVATVTLREGERVTLDLSSRR